VESCHYFAPEDAVNKNDVNQIVVLVILKLSGESLPLFVPEGAVRIQNIMLPH
jgi:hypothetical protein